MTTCAKCGGPLVEGRAAAYPPAIETPAVDAKLQEADAWSAAEGVGVAEDDDGDKVTPSVPLAPPPRPVPPFVRLHCILGGLGTQMGWCFFGFGMVFVWVFGSALDVTPIYFALWGSDTVGAVVASTDGTSWEVNDQPVFAHHYRYTTPGGAQLAGTAYAPGSRLEAGTPVTVEYVPGRPEISRIQGMGGGIIPMWAGALILIFPLVGLGFVVGGLRRGLKGGRLLAIGRLAAGALKSKRRTNARVNRRPVFRLTFEFTGPTGLPHEVVTKTHEPERLEDERREPLLYDPANPDYAVMLDSLPGAPRIDETGHFFSPVPARSVAALVVPLATVVGHSAYLLFRHIL